MSDSLDAVGPAIANLGPLSSVRWPGSISFAEAVNSQPDIHDLVEELISNINDYYVAVNGDAKTRCIDGRFDPSFETLSLGPQVPGGSVGATLAYKLSVGRNSLGSGDFASDAAAMFETLSKLDIVPGGHRDDHSDGISAVGCGAIDKMNMATELLSDKKYIESIYDLTKSLLGDSFDDDNFYKIIGSAVILNTKSHDYFKNRSSSFDILERKIKNSVSTLVGKHQECIVVANFVTGTTLAENKLVNDYNGVQVFNYDVWRTLELANKLFPKKKDEHNKQLFITARAMTAISTLMCLTDGSQILLTRS